MATTTDERSSVGLLLRRTGFGATGAAIDAAVAAGYGATVDAVLASLVPSGDAAADAIASPDLATPSAPGKGATADERKAYRARRRAQSDALVEWWVERMIVADHPAAEKLTWFWHGHFATSIDKVRNPALMRRQHDIFRRLGAGDVSELTVAVAQDPAMLIWLDANTNVAAHPNENFARELMELFTVGIGAYTEQDVKEVARTFTGWSYDHQSLAFVERASLHDSGTKTILGQTGPFDGLDTIRLIAGTDASARFVAARLWSRYARPIDADDPIAHDLAATWHTSRRGDVLLRAVLMHPEFRADATRSGLVKQPVEWAVGTVRAFGLSPQTRVTEKLTVGRATAKVLADLGQTPFRPPSVGGWPAQAAWLNTAADQVKLTFARALAPAALATPAGVALQAAGDRPAHLAWMLGLDGWRPATAAALATVADDAATLVILGLTSPDVSLA